MARRSVWVFTDVPAKPDGGGADLRRWVRLREYQALENLVYNRLPGLAVGLQQGKPDLNVSEEAMESWLTTLEENLGGRGKQALRRFLGSGLRRGVAKLRWKVTIPRRLIQITEDACRLEADAGRLLGQYQVLRAAFLRSLTDSRLVGKCTQAGEGAATPEDVRDWRAGQLLLGALMFGGLLHRPSLLALGQHFPSGLRHHGEWCWIELIPDQRRWFPDPITELLLLRWQLDGLGRIPTSNEQRPMTQQATWRLMRQYIRASVPGRGRQWKSLQSVLAAAIANARSHSESYLVEVAAGNHSAQSMPESAWWRWITQRPLRTEAGDHPESAPAGPGSGSETSKHASRKPGTLSDGALDLGTVLTDLRLLVSAPRRKAKQFPDGFRIEADQQDRLRPVNTQQLTRYLNNNWQQLPSLGQALGAWCEHMLLHGTPRKRRPAARTVYTYYVTIAAILEPRFDGLDLTAIDEPGYQLLYAEALECVSLQNYAYTAGRLIAFHDFLESAFGVPGVDWSDILIDDLPGIRVDANILTPTEYHIARRLLAEDSHSSERLRSLRVVVLLILYRFGVRVGEALQLRVCDVLDTNGILVRPNSYGNIKTECGIRHIPSGSRLDDQDQHLLIAWLRRRATETGPDVDPDALLFADAERSHFSLPDRMVTARVLQALRLASGDSGLRLRHLRHNFATCQLLSTRLPSTGETGDGGSPTGLLSQWLRGNPIDAGTNAQPLESGDLHGRRSLWMLSASLGHSVPATTLRHYTHSCDLLLKAAVTADLPALTSAQLGGLADLSAANVRQLQRRKGDQANASILERRRKACVGLNDSTEPSCLGPRHDPTLSLPPFESAPAQAEMSYTLTTICKTLRMARRTSAYKAGIKFQLPISLVEAWSQASEAITQLRTARGSVRHTDFEQCALEETGLAQRISAAIGTLPVVDPVVIKGLSIYALGRLGRRVHIDFLYTDSLTAYLQLLGATGLRPTEVLCAMGNSVTVPKQLADLASWVNGMDAPAGTKPPPSNCYRVYIVQEEAGLAFRSTVAHHWPYQMALVDLVARGSIGLPDYTTPILSMPDVDR